jgi:phosphate ABC transporter phosphate-binding protein
VLLTSGASGLLAAVTLLLAVTTTSAAADSYVPVTGAGSTWSQVAIDAWRVNVAKIGLTVNYSGTGSTDGRQEFISHQADFAASEIPFQTANDPAHGISAEHPDRAYAYMPDVAGGTSFMYHLDVAGHRITNLRLSGETLSKIFTGGITNWSDPAITHDYGRQLPSEPITPIIRSDGSGTSAQFSLFILKRYPSIWNAFCQKYTGATPPCGLTSFWPSFPNSKAQSGSNGVANYVAASYGEGAIGYVEYAYARNLGFPVSSVLNSAGYYVQPNASDVAVALTRAQINADLTQKLDFVYANPDPRTYPLSSYSYMIVPTSTQPPFNTSKGRSLSTFINYVLCAGQQLADPLGYSPLPKNLVLDGFNVVRKIPGYVNPPTNLDTCHNPTFQGGVNTLLLHAPYPASCNKAGQGPCANPSETASSSAGGRTRGSTSGSSSGSNAASSGRTTATGGGPSGTAALGSGPAANSPAAGGAIDPETGLPVGSTGATNGGSLAASQVALPPASTGATQQLLYIAAAVELAVAVLAPPFVFGYLRRRRAATDPT